MTDRRVSVALPGGLWRDGACHRTAVVRPLSGRDDEVLLETRDALSPAERVTELIERCVERVGDLPVDRAAACELSVGDREALLLQLRRVTVGDRVECVLDCPECDAAIEFELDARALLEEPAERAAPPYTVALDAGGGSYDVRFRLPTGGDQEALVAMARHDSERATGELLRRCVEEARDAAGEVVDEVPAEVGVAVAAAMADLDPQAAIELSIACPECEATVAAPFDVSRYVLEEAAARGRRLEHEVHALALTYHWSESDIVSMAPGRRRRYLSLLAESDLEQAIA